MSIQLQNQLKIELVRDFDNFMPRQEKNPRIAFPDKELLARKFLTTEREFHREIKPRILADFPEILEKLKINNPDIGVDKDNIIYLADTAHKVCISTGIKISSYI